MRRNLDISQREVWIPIVSMVLLCLLSISFVAEHGIFMDCENLEIVENPESEKEKEAKHDKKVLIFGLSYIDAFAKKAQLSNPKAAFASIKNEALSEVQTPPPEVG